MAAVHNRRARIEGAKSEPIDRSVVFARDDYTCRLCGDVLDMTAKWPEPWSPTIDHIVPLS
ncbi:MAG: HNH endonuclease, partial [Lacisediminihabitans sp.]